MIRTTILGVALAFAAAANIGCEEKKSEEKPAAPAAAAPAAPAAAEPAAAPPSGGAPAAAAPAAPGGAPAAGAPAGDPGKALAAALGAAAQAPKGDTPCEQAYNGITAMIEAMEKSMPKGGGAKNEMPTKEKFMAGCSALPKEMQQCMVMSYAMAHQKECQDAQAKMDPATAAKVKELMGKK
jgi:hypothetical protein